MKSFGSYSLETFTDNREREIARLRHQVALFWEREFAQYRAYGLRDDMDVLDCGCGPGFILEEILTALPGCRGVALEVEKHFIVHLQKRFSERGIHRYRVINGDVTEIALPDNSVDFVVMRLVLEHLPEPLAALREVQRVMKPGGTAVMIDNDFDLHLKTYPHMPALKELYDAYCRCRIDQGGNPCIGRELPLLLQQAGFSDIRFDILCAHSALTGDQAFSQSEDVSISTQLLNDGYLSSEAFERIALEWHGVLRSARHAFFRQLFVAAGTKSAAGPAATVPEHKPEMAAPRSVSSGPPVVSGPDAEASFSRIALYVQQQVGRLIDSPPDSIDQNAALLDMGFDSLAAVDLKMSIRNDLNVEITIAQFFKLRSIAEIARQIMMCLQPQGDPPTISAEDPDPDGWEEIEI